MQLKLIIKHLQKVRVYNMPYIGKGANGFGIRERYRYSASGSQTAFTGSDLDSKTLQIDNGSLIDVYLNGVLLDTADYNTNTANQVTLTSGATASDEVMIIVYDVFSLSDALSKSGGAMSGSITNFTSTGIDDNADATAITITSDEAVGIGKSLTPNNYSGYQSLTIGGSDATTGATVDLEDSSGNLEGRINGTNGIVYIEADPNGSTGASKISLEVDGSAKMTVLDGGDVNIANGNLVIGTAGKGIDFSAQTHATSTGGHGNPTVQSEVLSHYEEGEFNYGMNVNMTQETNANYGRYTRVGNLVTVNARMDIASVSGSNTVFFANLPFAVSAHTGSGRVDNLYIGTLQTYNVSNGGYDVMGKNILCENASGTAYAMYSVHNGNHAYILNSMVSTSSELYMTLTYRTG